MSFKKTIGCTIPVEALLAPGGGLQVKNEHVIYTVSKVNK